jgi:hypothetical protein
MLDPRGILAFGVFFVVPFVYWTAAHGICDRGDDSGDWYVALGWNDKKVIVGMDSVQATILEINEI